MSIMLYISKIHDYLKILTDGEVKDFLAINLVDTLNIQKQKKELYSKLSEK